MRPGHTSHLPLPTKARKGDKSEKFALVLTIGLIASEANASCNADAADKHLAGAALTSFMKKCQTDAAKTCEANSDAKKLAGAAKTSYVKKCVSEAVGP